MKIRPDLLFAAGAVLLFAPPPVAAFSVGAVEGVCGLLGTTHLPCTYVELSRRDIFQPVHQDITSLALEVVSYAPRAGTSPTDRVRFSMRVRKEIEDANARTDADFYGEPWAHFDNNNLQLGSFILKFQKDRILELLRSPIALTGEDLKRARDLLGRSLHSIQDFYSHSNWIETHAGSVDGPQFGVDTLAPPPPVSVGSSETYFCDSSLSRLTARGQSALITGFADALLFPSAPTGQCAHGLILDTGIHKDWDGRRNHGQARQVAELASQRFIQSIVDSPGNTGHEDNVCIFMTDEPCPKSGYSFVTFDPPGDLIPIGLWATKASINNRGEALFTIGPVPGHSPVGLRGLLYADGVKTIIHAPDSLTSDESLDWFCRPPGEGSTVSCSVIHTVPRAMNDFGNMVGSVGILRIVCMTDSFGQELCDTGSVIARSFVREEGRWSLRPPGVDTYDISNNGLIVDTNHFSAIDPSLYATGINSQGQIVGFTAFSFSDSNGFLYASGAFTPITVMGAGVQAFGINDLGEIVGIYWKEDGGHAYVASAPYGADDFVTIDVPDSRNTEGLGINSLGQVVGIYFDDQRQRERFFIATPPVRSTP